MGSALGNDKSRAMNNKETKMSHDWLEVNAIIRPTCLSVGR